jgi:hypothetical protein
MSDPHVGQFNGFRVESGTSTPELGKIDYCIATDNNQGLIFCQNGDLLTRNKASSHELCGTHLTDDTTPAKTIDAANGDIHIRAKNGTIILEAANIRLVGVDGKGGEITIQASKICNIDAPTVSGQGTNISFAGASKTQIAGTSLDLATSTKAACASGVDTDSSSIMGQILKAIKDFKDFFSSICEDKPGG